MNVTQRDSVTFDMQAYTNEGRRNSPGGGRISKHRLLAVLHRGYQIFTLNQAETLRRTNASQRNHTQHKRKPPSFKRRLFRISINKRKYKRRQSNLARYRYSVKSHAGSNDSVRASVAPSQYRYDTPYTRKSFLAYVYRRQCRYQRV